MMISIYEITEDRQQFLSYLLLADESEEVVLSYIHDGYLFAIEHDKKIVGVALYIETEDGEIELKNIGLIPSARGKGFGKQAVMQGVMDFQKRGYKKIIVGTANSSIDNIKFYQRLGFRMMAIKRDFFKNYPKPIFENSIQALDMIMFEKELI